MTLLLPSRRSDASFLSPPWHPLAALMALAAGPVLADVKAGVDAWSEGDYARAVVEWQGPAAEGDADKQDLANRICEALTVHAQIEEEIFYPAVREAAVENEKASTA